MRLLTFYTFYAFYTFYVTDELTKDHRSIARDLELLRAIVKHTKLNGRQVVQFDRIPNSQSDHFRVKSDLYCLCLGMFLFWYVELS